MRRFDSIAVFLLVIGLVIWWLFSSQNMNLKNGVSLSGVQGPTLFALGVAKAIYAAFGQTLTVTSTTDGTHPAGGENDPHYSGYAADLRTNGIATSIVDSIFSALESALKPLGFASVLESDHIHIQYNGGSLFGPAPWFQIVHGGGQSA